MRDLLRAETMKITHGLWMLPTFILFALAPLVVYTNFTPERPLSAMSDAEATSVMLAILVSATLASSFGGTWNVTREYYYGSMPRTAQFGSRGAVFTAKVVAGAVTGALGGLVAAGIWAALAGPLLADSGATFIWDADTVVRLVRVVGACALSGTLGVGIAWIVPSYYGASAVALALPLLVELPALTQGAAVSAFLPNTAIARIGGLDSVSPAPLGLELLVAAVWIAAVLALGLSRFRRRDL